MTMRAMRRQSAAGLAAAILLGAMALALGLAGCGGGAVGSGVGLAVGTAPAGPPLDFGFALPAAPLSFSVEIASEAEVRGTSYISNLRYQWEARDWQPEGEDWTCEVRFSKLSAGVRSGGGMAIEPQDAVKRLEGFSTRYRKTKSGFEPVARPSKDDEFLAVFDQLQGGLAPLDITVPAQAPRPGESWQEPLQEAALAAMRSAMKDSMVTYTYVGDESWQGRSCARLRYKGKLELDGLISAPPRAAGGGSARVSGRIELEGGGLFDKSRGFMLQDAGKAKFVINQRATNEKGEATGAEQSIVQNLNYTVKYLGN